MPLAALAGTRIRQRRSVIGMAQADLARAAGISASYLNLIEHNRRRVGPEVLARLAEALGVDAAALTGAAEAALHDELREAAAAGADPAPEIDRVEDFAGRFPGWAALVAAQARRIAQLERTVEALSDRMSHDPHLSAALHEVLSAAAAVRSTAAILTDTPDLEPVWRARFERNLAADTSRLALGAEALVAYLDGVAELETGIVAPQEEVEAWLAARGWHLDECEPGASAAVTPEVASAAAWTLAAQWVETVRADAAALPLEPVLAALAAGAGPGEIARAFAADPLRVFRRLATLPEAALPPGAGPYGLALCDGAGALLFRKPLPGFGMPRSGAACALWPLFSALAHPGLPQRATVEMPGPVRFEAWAYAAHQNPGDFDRPPVLRAGMLIAPAGQGAGSRAVAVGATCRICPRAACPARREPAIVAATTP
jgi:transcriptional regulator with XRE-family HTH domain